MKTFPMQLFTYDEESFSPQEESAIIAEIKELLEEKQAVLVAHYYTSAALQKLAEETGGIVSDSLEMAKFGSKQTSPMLIVAGVKFMGETAKILNPEKTILMPTLEAECSLDLSCPIQEFSAWCDRYPDRVVVVYANTSAEVKARADWVVTSGSALSIVQKLHAEGRKILWGPDKHLGAYVQEKSGADMLLWNGSCIVHEAFKEKELRELMLQHPDAKVLVHPESPQAVIALADVVGSTTALINAVRDLPSQKFIVATDNGIFYKMKAMAPEKTLLEAPTAGAGATCKSCAHCPWMAMNGLRNLRDVLLTGNNEIKIEESVRAKAEISVRRLMNFR